MSPLRTVISPSHESLPEIHHHHEPQVEIHHHELPPHTWDKVARWLIVLLLLLLFLHAHGWAQGGYIIGYPQGTTSSASPDVMAGCGAADPNHNCLSIWLPEGLSVTATNPSVGTNSATAPTSSTQIGGLNGGKLLPLLVDANGNMYVSGTLTNNGGTTSGNNLGVLPCYVGTAPTYTAGYQVLITCDTNGSVKVVNNNAGTFAIQVQDGSKNAIGSTNGALSVNGACPYYAFYDSTPSAGTAFLLTIVGGSPTSTTDVQSGKAYRLCGYSIVSNSSTTNTVGLVYGTKGTNNCDTGQTKLTPAYTLIQGGSTIAGKQVLSGSPVANWATASANQLCGLATAAQAVQIEAWFGIW